MDDFGLGQIGQIAITVTDTDRSVPFYRDILGLPFLFEFPSLAFFDCAGVRLMLSAVPEPDTHSSVIYFKVDDIQQAYRKLLGRGAVFESEPRLLARLPDHDLWMAMLRDPDRNLLGLMCEVRNH